LLDHCADQARKTGPAVSAPGPEGEPPRESYLSATGKEPFFHGDQRFREM
jgi:hypothetical protein